MLRQEPHTWRFEKSGSVFRGGSWRMSIFSFSENRGTAPSRSWHCAQDDRFRERADNTIALAPSQWPPRVHTRRPDFKKDWVSATELKGRAWEALRYDS